jgi:transposase
VRLLLQKKLLSKGEIVGFLKEFDEEMEVAIEATPSWYWPYDCLEGEGSEVRLSHGTSLALILV